MLITMVFYKQLIFVFATFVLVKGRPQIEPPKIYDYHGLFNNFLKNVWENIENTFTFKDAKNMNENSTLGLSMSNNELQVLLDTNNVSYNLNIERKQLRVKPKNQRNEGNNDPNRSDKINETLDPKMLDINYMENLIQSYPSVINLNSNSLPVEGNNDQLPEVTVTTDMPDLNKILINEQDLAIALNFNTSYYLITGAPST